jgi:hypothetical protein
VRINFFVVDKSSRKCCSFKLNTAVENPHENYINSIAFPPTDSKELKFVSVGGDKKFYVWFLTETENVGSKYFKFGADSWSQWRRNSSRIARPSNFNFSQNRNLERSPRWILSRPPVQSCFFLDRRLTGGSEF